MDETNAGVFIFLGFIVAWLIVMFLAFAPGIYIDYKDQMAEIECKCQNVDGGVR